MTSDKNLTMQDDRLASLFFSVDTIAKNASVLVVTADDRHEAIKKNTEHFTSVTLVDGCRLDDMQGSSFDIVIAIDTFRLSEEPRKLLALLSGLVSEHGTLLISNMDHEHEADLPFLSFKGMAEEILGPARAWALGFPAHGFSFVPVSSEGELPSPSEARLTCQPLSSLGVWNCHSFYGVWGKPDGEAEAFTVSVSVSDQPVHNEELIASIKKLSSEGKKLSQTNDIHTNKEFALQQEIALLKAELKDIKSNIIIRMIMALKKSIKKLCIR